jgi:hypothetical protein
MFESKFIVLYVITYLTDFFKYDQMFAAINLNEYFHLAGNLTGISSAMKKDLMEEEAVIPIHKSLETP